MKHSLLLLLFFASTLTAFAQNELSVEQMLEKGINAEQLGLFDLARDYYTQAQTNAPDNAEPNLRLGLLAERRCHYLQAINSFRSTIALNDTSAAAYEHLAYCLIEKEDFTDIANLTAITEQAIELTPSSASAYASMALIYCEQKNYTNAITWAKRALEAQPKYARGYNTLGIIYYHRGNDNDAITQFREALKIDPNNIDAYYNLGVMFVLRNNHETAISYLTKGLQRDNKSVKLYYYLGIAYIQRGDAQKAISCYETIIQQIDSLFTPAYNRLGAIYCSKGDYDKATAYHQKAARIDPNDPESYKCLGKVSKDRGTYCLIAQLYGKQGNSARETSSYKKAAKLGNKEAQRWMVQRVMAW